MRRSMIVAMTMVLGLAVTAGSALAQNFDALGAGERQAMDDSLQYALENNPTNQPAQWVNPDADHSGEVVPVRTFENAQGQPCREFITTVTIGGRQEQAYGTACRQANGDWQIVSDQQSAPPAVAPPAVQGWYDYPHYLPERYYYDPYGYYAPFNIFFSFSFIHHDGHRHVFRHVDGRRFRHHHPLHVRERAYVGRFADHPHWHKGWGGHNRHDDWRDGRRDHRGGHRGGRR